MAEESNLEQTAKTAPQQDKKEEKPKSVWRSALEEIADAGTKAAKLGLAFGIPYVADRGIGNFSGMGGYDASATSAAFYLADRKNVVRKSIIGTAFAAFAKYTIGLISNLSSYVARATLVPAWQALANAYYITTKHLVEKKTLTGIVENFKQNYKRITKKAIYYLALPTLLTTFLPGPWQIPAIALQSYIFAKYIAPDEKDKSEEKEKTTYRAAFRSLGEKISKAFYSPLRGAEYFGRGIRNFYQSLNKKSTPAPAAQPATQSA